MLYYKGILSFRDKLTQYPKNDDHRIATVYVKIL